MGLKYEPLLSPNTWAQAMFSNVVVCVVISTSIQTPMAQGRSTRIIDD